MNTLKETYNMKERMMLNQGLCQTNEYFTMAYKCLSILFAVSLIFGCNPNHSGDFVKLDAPLKEVLPKLTLEVPEEEDENGEPIVITVGDAFSGKGEYSIGNGETHEFQYNFFKQHVAEGHSYIFAVVSYNWGGSGTFYYLTAIDKTTLKGDKEYLLGDRVEIKKLATAKRPVTSDIVSMTYMDRDSETSMSEKPDKLIEYDFIIKDGELTTVKFVDM